MDIPSFSSFPDLEQGPSKPSVANSGSQKRAEKKRRKSNERGARNEDRHDVSQAVPHADSLATVFYADRKGDPLNITFGGLHSRIVPKYRRVSGTLGLPPKRPHDEYRYESRYIFQRNLSKSAKRLTFSMESPQMNQDYIALSSSAGRNAAPGILVWESEGSSSDDSTSNSVELDLGLSAFATLEARIKANPLDVSTWRLLIYKSAAASPDAKSAAHVKTAVVDRALSFLPNCAPLLAERARLSSSFLGAEETGRLWDSALVLSRGAGRTDVWKEWLGWVFKTKGLEEGVQSISRAIDACRSEPGSSSIDLFGVACAVLMESGYTERAISAYQAVLEMYCHSHTAKSIETWWDKELPRLGQSDYVGMGTRSDQTDAIEPDRGRPVGGPFAIWVADEILLSNDVLPPPAGLADDSDPYRTTLFHDIAPLLPKKDLSAEEFFLAAADLLGLLGMGESPRLGPEVGTVQSLPRWFDAWQAEKVQLPAKRVFIRNLFIQLRPYMMEGTALDRWNGLELAFEYSINRKGHVQAPLIAPAIIDACPRALKHAKHLLSMHPSSLHLWSLYADLEQSTGKKDSARKVYRNVLRNPAYPQVQTERLWFKWASLEWQEGAVDSAISVLCESVLGEEGHSPVRILKAKQVCHLVLRRWKGPDPI
ncbi:hypothetical protein CALVIDRAFT_43031 [Calocera viscosa TUFC12733]|uniref:DUF1740-domain-containing protein n=1 Tax=Calocera viscosa (strain TUFC12733) TaxID=1330018 RepID=A0A167P2Z3_CALVF|nr:hypothetical protein CALVIDRAFT_43031 [Calocera viscosa TUFC12733]